jgi:hypothetical protein
MTTRSRGEAIERLPKNFYARWRGLTGGERISYAAGGARGVSAGCSGQKDAC